MIVMVVAWHARILENTITERRIRSLLSELESSPIANIYLGGETAVIDFFIDRFLEDSQLVNCVEILGAVLKGSYTNNEEGNIQVMLLQEKIDMICGENIAGRENNSLLHIAASEGNARVMAIALKVCSEKEVLIDKMNGDSKTPLFIAAEAGYADVVQVLLENQADPTVCARDKPTVRSIGGRYNRPELDREKGSVNLIYRNEPVLPFDKFTVGCTSATNLVMSTLKAKEAKGSSGFQEQGLSSEMTMTGTGSKGH